MEGGKKVAIAVVLILIIVAGVVWQLKRSGTIGGPTIPDYVLDRKSWKIDGTTLESMELSYREWRSLGHDKQAKFKNPKTDTYTMVDRMRCGSCDKWIPVPEHLVIKPSAPGGPGAEQDPIMMQEKIQEEYICPICGKHAFVRGPRGIPPPPPRR